MSLIDSIRAWVGRGTRYENVTYVGPTVPQVLGLSAEDLYRTQPHLRTVVSYLARNVAQLPLQGFERVSDTDRRRVRDDPAVMTLRRPNPSMTGYELFHSLTASMKVYDVAVWLLAESPEAASGWQIWPVPASWVASTGGGTAWAPQWIEVVRPSGRRAVLENVPGATPQFVVFHGWDPTDPAGWSSPVEALRQVLAEQISAWDYRSQVWKRAGRVGSYLTRPKDAPQWSTEAKTRFARDWKDKWSGSGPSAGGTPLLEDGMELKSSRFNAREEEWSEVAKLSLATVAGVYHVSPTMVGILDNANFSNVREFSRMLYTDTLGPDLAMVTDRLNTFVVPVMSPDPDVYVEFNFASKLAGSFEEQAQVLSTSIGRPWMTADEGRARMNMPAIGGDAEQLVTPLNVLVGGQHSPRDGTTAGGGSAQFTGDDLKQRVEAAAVLIRSGFDPAEALEAVGLDPIKHLGLLPITVQKPVDPPGTVDEDLVDEITAKGRARTARPLTRSGPVVSRESLEAPVTVTSAPREEDQGAAEQVLVRFFRRQRAVVLSRLGAPGDAVPWWDADRWDTELAQDLLGLAVQVTSQVAQQALDGLGIEADLYSVARTMAFLQAVAESRARMVNSTTKDQLDAALAEEVDEAAERSTPAGVFDLAESSRSRTAAVTLATMLAGFAVTEVGRQVARPQTTKTWVVTSKNPRASHAAMDGQTVLVGEAFSNGMAWPGDPSGGPDQVAGCLCGVELTIP